MVDIRFAKPKSIPVVTAICPRRLNLYILSVNCGDGNGGGGGLLPSGDPGKEGGLILGSKHVGPEVGTAGSRY